MSRSHFNFLYTFYETFPQQTNWISYLELEKEKIKTEHNSNVKTVQKKANETDIH